MDSQRLIETVRVVQSNFAQNFTIGKTLLENSTGEFDETNIKQLKINLFFNTSFFAQCLSLLARSFVRFFTMVCRRHVNQFNNKVV